MASVETGRSALPGWLKDDPNGVEAGLSGNSNHGGDGSPELKQYDKPASKGRNRMILIGAILIVVIGIVVGVVIALGGKETSTSPALSSPSGSPPSTPTAPSPSDTPSPTSAPTTTSEIRNVIANAARKGGAEFEDPTSYQSRAIAWVSQQDLPVAEIDLTMEEQALQLYALACILHSTNASSNEFTDFYYGDELVPGWHKIVGWLESPSTYCSWWGITCDDNDRVQKIDLSLNGLSGSFPAEVAYLKDSLTYLDLYANGVHNYGDEGNSFLGELVNLEYLYYRATSFEYEGIPTEIGLLTNLVEYDCSYTLYSGKIPSGVWSGLTELEYIVLSGNAYNSSLPSDMTSLPKLEYIYARDCFLEGNVDFLGNMPSIVEVWIDTNPALTGSLPSNLWEADTLESLWMTGGQVSGSLPTELGLMTNMGQLWLSDNRFTGTIPTELAKLRKLKALHLEVNDLTGTMPPGVCSNRIGLLQDVAVDCDSTVTCQEGCCDCCGEVCLDS